MRVFFTLVVFLLGCSFSADAEHFSVAIDVSKSQQSLTIKQRKALKLPRVKVSHKTVNGTVLCDSDGNNYGKRNSCRGTARNGVFEVTGRANASISIQLPVLRDQRSGLRLDLYAAGTNNRTYPLTLGPDGSARFEILGVLTVEDVDKVNTAPQVFDFEIQATYH